MKTKTSVFGGTGFIGSNYVNLKPDECIVIPRESRKPMSDSILYFISTTHNYHVLDDVHKDVSTNLSVLLEVLEQCKDRDVVFNFISSWFVYGDTTLPALETSCCKPKGFYSITKLCAEQLIESFCKTYNIHYRILRLCNVYGTGDILASKKKNALQYLIDQIKCDKPIDLYHGGDFIRDYLHVTDVCQAIDLILKEGDLDQIYNVGSGIPHRFRDMIDEAINTVNSKTVITDVSPPDFHNIVQVKDMFLDTQKLINLGFEPKISINEGISLLCQP